MGYRSRPPKTIAALQTALGFPVNPNAAIQGLTFFSRWLAAKSSEKGKRIGTQWAERDDLAPSAIARLSERAFEKHLDTSIPDLKTAFLLGASLDVPPIETALAYLRHLMNFELTRLVRNVKLDPTLRSPFALDGFVAGSLFSETPWRNEAIETIDLLGDAGNEGSARWFDTGEETPGEMGPLPALSPTELEDAMTAQFRELLANDGAGLVKLQCDLTFLNLTTESMQRHLVMLSNPKSTGSTTAELMKDWMERGFEHIDHKRSGIRYASNDQQRNDLLVQYRHEDERAVIPLELREMALEHPEQIRPISLLRLALYDFQMSIYEPFLRRAYLAELGMLASP